MITVNSGDLDTKVSFLRLVEDESVMGAGKETLSTVADVMAQALDQLPPSGIKSGSAGEEGWQCRIMIRYRTDIAGDMLVRVRGRLGKIISGPSIVGRRAGLVMQVEGYRPQGGAA